MVRITRDRDLPLHFEASPLKVARIHVVVSRVEFAAITQHRGEYFGVPAAARREFDDRHVRAEAKECERLLGSSKRVSRPVVVAAMRAGNGRIKGVACLFVQRLVIRVGADRRQRGEAKRNGGNEPGISTKVIFRKHESSLAEVSGE